MSVVDRKKELIITAGGENVSPAAVENLLVEHPLIGQALAYGDRQAVRGGAAHPRQRGGARLGAGPRDQRRVAGRAGAHPDVLAEVTAAVAEANHGWPGCSR